MCAPGKGCLNVWLQRKGQSDVSRSEHESLSGALRSTVMKNASKVEHLVLVTNATHRALLTDEGLLSTASRLNVDAVGASTSTAYALSNNVHAKDDKHLSSTVDLTKNMFPYGGLDTPHSHEFEAGIDSFHERYRRHTDPWWWPFGRWHAGLSENASIGVLLILVLCFGQWFVDRFTDGIWPSERKLAKEMRRKAQAYIDAKKSERDSLLRPAGSDNESS
jgi:hypothetical protein